MPIIFDFFLFLLIRLLIYEINKYNLGSDILVNELNNNKEVEVTRSELIERVAGKNPHLSMKEVEKIVAVIFDSITAALAGGERIEFRGFGAFSVRRRSPRVAKNPRTGEKVSVEERIIPHFKTGKQLHELLNKQ